MSGAVKEFLRFVNASVSPYHAVHQARTALEAAGYELISEAAPWKLKAGGKYYFTRSQSSIVAFAIGGQFKPGNGFNVVACHTDSPVLKVKPVSIHQRAGYLQVGVEPYGGGLWHTWFDRDLGLAGRVLVRNGSQYVSRLVHIDRPILRIPNLAIHLNRAVNTDGFQFNLQTHVLPVLATAVKSELENPSGAKHQALLLKLLADELKCDPADVADFDLVLCDTQPAQLTGAMEEFVASPRLDNLCMSFCGLKGLAEASGLDSESAVRVLALFDHEEVGSQSDHGAGSPIMLDLVKRVTSVFAGSDTPPDVVEVAMRKSFLVSADMAHALHPNYAEKHEEHHQPMMHRGVVLKINSNQRYATSALTALPLRLVANRAGVTLQEFVVRNDSACGSTIGPIIAALCGMRTVDIGVPQLAMHSIREMCGASDIDAAVQLCTAFYTEFTAIDASVHTEL